MSNYFHSLALLSLSFFLHLVSLSYGQEPDDEEDDPSPTRKRPILRKIVILVGIAIGFAALCWALHRTYKAYCRWSQKRRRLIGRKEFDAMMEDLEKQEKDSNSNTPASKEDQTSGSASGKYMPLNCANEEEPLMTIAEGSRQRALQHESESTNQTGEVSTPLLFDVPLDDSDTLDGKKMNVAEQIGARDRSVESSASLEEEERETQAL